MKFGLRLVASSILGMAAYALVLFLPAGTIHYWQGWAFIALFTAVSIGPTIYLARKRPAALRRRMHAGPQAETRMAQKMIITGAFGLLFGIMAFSAFDHRMGWSTVPVWLCLVGDVLMAAGLGIAMLVVIENSYAAATVTVESGQKVATGGLYRFVRHPMYAGNVIMMVGMALALGSYWALLFVIPGVTLLVLRILDEEKLLKRELPGYREYAQHVRYRLLPSVW
ncbi:isoprenylcysteine carboxylmethyltransferase family protein [Mycobacterium sp. SMC-2]|uniref:methyltransferase family protein n=1 Tax=Mycobacterium sp. SMC-2 TaxID=2857058 RepID=UPI0021B40831|nr:isoprenylcysteine carboxylmethyltransferase family protein [Mycobacterium sp. SMC-2]UXA05654.1 isoprenylcysteine carboxylmethyltransferase family protein [Mycobacterium sp. SMC-2]